MEELQLRRVVPYTTRPIRSGETEGESYFFCSEERVAEFEREGKIIELRAYDTMYGVWKYFTADDGQIVLAESDYLMIGTLEAYEQIRAYFGAEHVCPIYVEVDDGVRLQRALERGTVTGAPKSMRKCVADFWQTSRIFQRKILKKGRDTKHFLNKDLDQVTQEIASYIDNKY